MALRARRLEFTPAELKAATLANAALALVPRLKTDAWRLTAGQWLSVRFGLAAEQVSALWLQRQGVTVQTLDLPSPDGPVPVRILRPAGPPRGVVLDIHGGGWVVGSAGLNDGLNAHMVEAGLAVVSVDYRLLNELRDIRLEHAVADCLVAGRWLATSAGALFGTRRLILTGESAGAHLGALTALALREEGLFGDFVGCIFAYGVFDLSGTPSVRAAGPETLLLDGPNLVADLGRLAPGRDEAGRRAADVSPLHADLTGLPPALFLFGEIDPLRDDSRLMARAWGDASDAELVELPATPHGFLHLGSAAAVKSWDAIRDWLETRLPALSDPVSVENVKL